MFSKLSSLRQPFNDNLDDLNMDSGFKRLRFDDDTRNALDSDPMVQITNTESFFGDNGIPGNKISELSVDKLIAGTMQVGVSIASLDYVPNTTGFKINAGDPIHGTPSSIDIMNGNFSGSITGANITIAGTGYARAGKTSFTDSTHAGWYLGNTTEGVYFGAASDTSYIKYDISANTISMNCNLLATSKIFTSSNQSFDASLVASSALNSSTMGFQILFGNGSDGDLTVSETTNINSDKQYNNLTINNGGKITSSTNKYIYIAVKGTLTINSGGKIDAVGIGSLGGINAVGADGSGSGVGVDYLDFTRRIGSSGGGGGGSGKYNGSYSGSVGLTGGNGYLVGATGGAGGTNASPNGVIGGTGIDINQLVKDRIQLYNSMLLNAWGSGGGAGGSSSGIGLTSGNGGNGGGVIYIEARNIVIDENTNAIDASGGVGSVGTNGTGVGNERGSGGGAGGSGGVVFVKYQTFSNVNGANTNIKVSGGTGGVGGTKFNANGGDGGTGGAGGGGVIYLLMVS